MAKSKSYAGIIFLSLIVLSAAGGSWYYFFGRPAKEPEYSTVKVTRGNIIQTITATGNLQTTSQVTISSQVSGNVIAINADFNDHVTKGQWLLKIDPSTYEQKLKQAKADLDAASANTIKIRGDVARTKELFTKNLVSQSEADSAVAQLAQAESALISRQAAMENAQTDLARCTIYSPIEGVVLNRTTDVGGTVNVNQSAVPLYTLINDLTRLQISADVSEADIGSVQEDQMVRFSVDAYLNRPFQGKVTQVRNFARSNNGVVTFSVIIGVDNSNLLLKPGMTATANIIIAERPNVLTVANNALRVRVPAELLAKSPAAAAPTTGEKSAAPLTDEERRAAIREIIMSAGIQPGLPPSPDVLEKIKKQAIDKGLDPVVITQQINRAVNRGMSDGGFGGPGGGGPGGSSGREKRGGRGGGGTGVNSGAGMNVSNQPRTLYKLETSAAGKKHPAPVTVHLGISDGSVTEVLDGVAEGDTLVTYVTMPGATPGFGGPSNQNSNPFQQGGGRGGYPGGGGGPRF